MELGSRRHTTEPWTTPCSASSPATPSAARSHWAKVIDRRGDVSVAGSTYASTSALTAAAARSTSVTVSNSPSI